MAIVDYSNLPYSVGTIKLTWIDPENYKVLRSQMFDSVEKALQAKDEANMGSDFLIFKLRETDGNRYAWDLLKYGRSSQYVNGMKFRDNPVLRYGSITLMVLGIVYIAKLVTKK